MDKTAPVVIAGAGPVGLSLALGLARMGVRSMLFEQSAELPPHSRAIVVFLRTVEALESWNVADRFFEAGEVLGKISAYSSATNQPLIGFDLSPLEVETPVAKVVILPQERTEKLLYDALTETGMCEVHFNHKITGVVEASDGVHVNVMPVDGEPFTVTGQFAVGADGAHSAVRQSIGLTLEGKTYPVHVFLADVNIDDERDKLPWPRIATQVSQTLAAIRFAPGQWRLIGAITEERATQPLDKAFLQAAVDATLGPGDFETVWESIFSIHRRHAASFRKGRVILAGDAAHINSPAGGQGMNSGIQDAHNLAWKIAYALRGADAETLMESYSQERFFAITHGVEALTDRLTRYGLSSKAFQRNALLPILGRLLKIPMIARKAMRAAMMLDTQYKSSPIFRGRSSLLGARSPIPETLVRYHPTVVLYEAEPAIHTAAHDSGVPDVTVTVCKHWLPWKCRAPFAALVRPDGVVGYFERNPTPQSVRAGIRAALGFAS